MGVLTMAGQALRAAAAGRARELPGGHARADGWRSQPACRSGRAERARKTNEPLGRARFGWLRGASSSALGVHTSQ